MHYKFTDDTIERGGVVLHRIIAIVDLPRFRVRCGDLGGWIEKKNNLSGDAWVSRNAMVFGEARVFGNAWVSGDDRVSGNADYIVFKNWWSSLRFFMWTLSKNMWRVGCFYGTGKELVAKAKKDSEISGREYARIVRYVEEILRAEKKEEAKK